MRRKLGGGAPFVAALACAWLLAAPPAEAAGAGQGGGQPVVLNWVGTTSHAWGAWVPAGASVEDWVEQAIGLCAAEEICEVNVFEGPEHVTHEFPVPEANRAGLKWVLRYQRGETPSVVVEEAQAEPGRELRTWTFDP